MEPVRDRRPWHDSGALVERTERAHLRARQPRRKGRHREEQVQGPSWIRQQDHRAHHADLPPGRMLVSQPEGPRAEVILPSMPRADRFEPVEKIGRTLPDVEVTTAWGKPALK